MTRDQIQANSLERIKKMNLFMIIGYAAIIIVAVLGITLFAVNRYNKVIKNKVGSMTSSLNSQLIINLDSYLKRMETVGTLAYAVDNAYTYNAADPSNDEYEAINTEKQISDDLMSLCLMENFVDYGLVYSNNHTVGKVSNGTTALFGDNLYTDLSAMITRSRSRDGWYTGYNNDYERIYYVKQFNDNTLFVISFYTAELDRVFENPDNLDTMTIRLTDSSYKTIYSSDKAELGSIIPVEILNEIQGLDSAVVSDSDNLSTVGISSGGWYVISSIPTKIILKEAVDTRRFMYGAGIIAALIAIAAGTLFIRRAADPVGTITAGLSDEISEDGFEGVLSNRYFRDKNDNIIKGAGNTMYALIMTDVDDFMNIVNGLGREGANAQLLRLVTIIREVFPNYETFGRLSEDSFAILIKAETTDTEVFHTEVVNRCVDLCDTYAQKERKPTMGIINITTSVGATIFPEGGLTYQELYDKAANALRSSKKTGKGKFTIL